MSTLLRMDSAMRFNIQNTNISLNNRDDSFQKGLLAAQGSNMPVTAVTQGKNDSAANNQQENKDANGNAKSMLKNSFDRNECRSCKTRQYVDGSNDPGVSFKTPQNISPSQSASAVAAHENEHVTRNKAAAELEGREVVSQTVILNTAVCNECGISYTSGGQTTTVTKAKNDPEAIQPRLDAKA